MNAIQTDGNATLANLSISEAAAYTGISAHTLRYYERIGLLRVRRGRSGHRLYSDDDVRRVLFITRLRQTDMPIQQIQRYFTLADQGPATEAERLELLLRHRDNVRANLETLTSALGAIDSKIDMYGGSGRPPAPATLQETP